MNKLNLARTMFECCLSGGCIAGGVECSKIGKSMQEKVDHIEKEKKGVDEKYDAELAKVNKLTKEVGCAKKVVEYSKSHFHTIGMGGKEAHQLSSHARDAKYGIKKNLEECGLKSYSDGLN